MNEYKKKLENVKENKNLKDLYILAFISTDTDIYITCKILSKQLSIRN